MAITTRVIRAHSRISTQRKSRRSSEVGSSATLKFPHPDPAKLNLSAQIYTTLTIETEVNDFSKIVADVIRLHIMGCFFA
jgi:hypothetical protein